MKIGFDRHLRASERPPPVHPTRTYLGLSRADRGRSEDLTTLVVRDIIKQVSSSIKMSDLTHGHGQRRNRDETRQTFLLRPGFDALPVGLLRAVRTFLLQLAL